MFQVPASYVNSLVRFVMAKAVKKSTKAEETAQFLLEIGATFGLLSSQRAPSFGSL